MRHKINKKLYPFIAATLISGLVANPLFAMDALDPARDQIIDMTIREIRHLSGAVELAPIKIRAAQVMKKDEFLIARAIHLYNQRRLSTAKGDLKQVLSSSPENKTLSTYLSETNSKLQAIEKPREVLEEEEKGVYWVEQAQVGGIYGREDFGSQNGNQRFTTNTALISNKANQQGLDWTNQFAAESMKLEGKIGDFKYSASASYNYYDKDNIRDDYRLRNATWWMKNKKIQLMLGDSSSYFSRYVLNGVNYRGVNLKMNLYKNEIAEVSDKFTIFWGKVPYFNLVEDRYLYARDAGGIRNELDLWNTWKIGTSFSYVYDDPAKIVQVNAGNRPKENIVFGVDQAIRIIPNIWTFYTDNAFSYADENTEEDDKLLRSMANYFVSDFRTKRIKVFSSYELVDENFRSFLGLSGHTADRLTAVDREHILNIIRYEPRDEIDLTLQYAKTRTNLDKETNTQSLENENYKANLKIMPTNELPRFSLRGSIWTKDSKPGMVGEPSQQTNWDTVFEMGKEIWDTDMSAGYGIRRYNQYINEGNGYGDAIEYSFSFSGSRKIYDRIQLTPSYTFAWAKLLKQPNSVSIDNETISRHLFNLNFATWFWKTAYLTFDYHFSTEENFATPSVSGSAHGFTTTFSWPFTKDLGFGKKFVLSPYLSYHYADGTSTYLERRYIACRLEGDYFFTENSKFNFSGELRDNYAGDPTYVGFGDEFRIMLTYKTVNGF